MTLLKQDTVAITGSSGFVGRAVTDYFLGLEWYVRGLDMRDRIDVASPNFCMAKGNLLFPGPKQVNLNGTDILIHAAGLTDAYDRSHDDVMEQYNCSLVQEALALCHDNHIPCLINVSSASVYGDVPAPFHEDGPTKPGSKYGQAKLAAENIVDKVSKELGLTSFSIRLFSPIGRHQRPGTLPWEAIQAATLHRQLISLHGVTWRAWTWVDDFARLCLFIAENHRRWLPGHYVFNFGSEVMHSQMRLFAAMETITQAVVPYVLCQPREFDMVHAGPDMSNTKRFLGDFVSKNTLDSGIKAMALHFRATRQQ